MALRRIPTKMVVFPSERAHETNDCAVIALAHVAGISYAEAHAMFKLAGRKNREGTTNRVIRDACLAQGAIKRFHYWSKPARICDGDYASWWRRGSNLSPTLAKFLQQNPVGRFLVVKPGHAFAILDGVVYDNRSSAGARDRIEFSYQFR